MKLLSLFAFAALAAPVAGSATALIDGSFETKGATTPVNDYCYDAFPAGGNAPCGPGAWGTNGGVIKSGSGPWGGTTTPDGNYFGMLQQNQVLSQTVVATSDGALQLSWLDANRLNNGGLHGYTVTINGDVIGSFTSGIGFAAKSASFNGLTGQSYTIAFNGIFDGSDTTSFIDGVALSVVPEPATWGLMVVGFGLVGFAARRRSAVVAA